MEQDIKFSDVDWYMFVRIPKQYIGTDYDVLVDSLGKDTPGVDKPRMLVDGSDELIPVSISREPKVLSGTEIENAQQLFNWISTNYMLLIMHWNQEIDDVNLMEILRQKRLEENKMFFDIIKKWTAFDYYTPGIKAEVILDMLLSEYIEEILKACLKSETDVRLIAKEFPIPTVSENDSRNAKVDYLCCSEDSENNLTLYLVELKTSASSIDAIQMLKYLCIAENMEGRNTEEVYSHLCNILKEEYLKKKEDKETADKLVKNFIEKARLFQGSKYPLWDWSVQNMYQIFFDNLHSNNEITEIISNQDVPSAKVDFINSLTKSQKYFSLFVRLLGKGKERWEDLELSKYLEKGEEHNDKKCYNKLTKDWVDDWIKNNIGTWDAGTKIEPYWFIAKDSNKPNTSGKKKGEVLAQLKLKDKELYKKYEQLKNICKVYKVFKWAEKTHLSENIEDLPFPEIHFDYLLSQVLGHGENKDKTYESDKPKIQSDISRKTISDIKVVYLAPVLDNDIITEKDVVGINNRMHFITYDDLIKMRGQKIKVKETKEKKDSFGKVLDILDYIHSYNLEKLYNDLKR